MANWAKSIIVYVLAGVVPAICLFALDQVFPIGGREVALLPLFLFSFIASAAFGFVLGDRGSAFLIALFVLVGICLGVIAAAAYDLAAHGIDHNLFPIEIIFDAFLVMPGMLSGLATAWWVRCYRKRKSELKLSL
jgi:hypothetical protein